MRQLHKVRKMGYLLLEGGSEFGGQMIEPDKRALSLAGGLDIQVSIIPTAAVPDGNHHRAGKIGRQWFLSLGAREVAVLPIIDRSSANDAANAELLARSGLIYLLGGFPGYLAQTMMDTASWHAAQRALHNGAVVAGSSAGAMVLCEHLYDPEQKRVVNGLGLMPNCCVLPHHEKMGSQWAEFLQKELPSSVLIGIDEQTGAINDGTRGRWTVYGSGAVTLYRDNITQRYDAGAGFHIQSETKKG